MSSWGMLPTGIKCGGGQNVYRVMVVHIHHAVARTACRSCRINLADLLVLCAHFQVDLMGGDFNAFSYRYYESGSQQIAASLQDSSLAVMLRRFDEGVNAQRCGVRTTRSTSSGATSTWPTMTSTLRSTAWCGMLSLMRWQMPQESHPRFPGSNVLFRSSMRTLTWSGWSTSIGITSEQATSASSSTTWGTAQFPEAKSSIIKNKYAIRYLAGQEKMCRLSGMAQRITPELLQLRQRDQDMHRVLKVALQPWPTLAGVKALIEFGIHHWAIPPVRLALSGRNSGKTPERPRKRSQSVSWNSRREYGWDAPNPVIQGIWGVQSISRVISPPVRLGALLFSEVVPERASQSRSWNSQQYWGHFWTTTSVTRTSERTTSASTIMMMLSSGKRLGSWPLIVPRMQDIQSSPSWRWTSSSMRKRHRGQLLIWTMDWYLVHPVPFLGQHWTHCQQAQEELCWGAVSPLWGVKQVTQRLWTAITLTLASPSECTASECASQEARHSCLSAYSELFSWPRLLPQP